MNTVLFASDGSPFKPVIASYFAQRFSSQTIKPFVAAKHSLQADPSLVSHLNSLGIPVPNEILAVDDIQPFDYDLIVFFADKGKIDYPSLPGNPAVIYWSVPDVSGSPESDFDKPYNKIFFNLELPRIDTDIYCLTGSRLFAQTLNGNSVQDLSKGEEVGTVTDLTHKKYREDLIIGDPNLDIAMVFARIDPDKFEKLNQYSFNSDNPYDPGWLKNFSMN